MGYRVSRSACIRFHDLRYTHAMLLLESGESVKYVAERLGDREDTAVETYAYVTPGCDRRP